MGGEVIEKMIQLINLHKSFGPQKVLDGVNLEIPEGSITVILGRSGEGKSVLIKHIIGLLTADSGQVVVDGIDIMKLKPADLNEFRKRFGMLFQNGALFDSLNVQDNVAFPLKEHTRLSKEEIDRIVEEKLALVGLRGIGHKMPAELSGGMRKRVGLARAIALSPQIILYDEPTTGLDPIMTDSVNNLILETQKKLHVTSVVISHDIESTFRVAGKVAMLHDGKIIAEGPPEKFKQSEHPFVRQFLEGKSGSEVV
jgi:phospholipid/cholesterol/gamma-HCH transport system ATP-binding protein